MQTYDIRWVTNLNVYSLSGNMKGFLLCTRVNGEKRKECSQAKRKILAGAGCQSWYSSLIAISRCFKLTDKYVVDLKKENK